MNFGQICSSIALVASTASCASSMGAVRDTVSSAPEWYQERAQEVRGEGYPSIGRIPTLEADDGRATSLAAGRASVLSAEELFRLDPRAVPPGLELDAMLEWASVEQASAARKAAEPGSHLTDSEVEVLKSLFETERARS